jgi:hypothetical protein
MTYARRTDENQSEVVAAIQKVGGVVTYLYRVGEGVSDLLVSFRNTWTVFEVKKDSRQKLTPDQIKWIGAQRAPVYVVTSGADAVTILTLIKP